MDVQYLWISISFLVEGLLYERTSRMDENCDFHKLSFYLKETLYKGTARMDDCYRFPEAFLREVI